MTALRKDDMAFKQKLIRSSNSRHYYFESPEGLLNAVEKEIKETEVVADIGCGIVPMSYFRPKLHIMVDPWKEYTDILTYRHAGDKSIFILQLGALEALSRFATNSVDSIFLLDVIEHIEKSEGFQIIKECERVARNQIILFTPLGFMPQKIEEGEKDNWGLSGGSMQEHLSGWIPEEFSKEWSFYICKDYHKIDHQNRPLSIPHGAFFAIRNFYEKKLISPIAMSDIRRPLPSELALQQVQSQLQQTQIQFQQTQVQLLQTQAQLSKYQNHVFMKLLRKVKHIFS